MEQRKALGRGLGSLIPNLEKNTEKSPEETSILQKTPENVVDSGENKGYLLVPIDKVVPNRQQPRLVFDEEKLRELSASIKEEGVMQPLVVSPISGGRFELIAGERRLRASRMAGLEQVPVVINDSDAESMLVLSILENIQREDLNAIEEALAYQELVDQYDYSHEQIGKKMGKSRTAVANSLRLLKLPQVVKDDLASNRYSAGHARAILSLNGIHEQLKMREQIIKTTPTVRDVERMIRERSERKFSNKSRVEVSPQVKTVLEKLKQALGLKVAIKAGKNGSGKITIDYYSQKDLEKIYERLIS